jgi:phospholipid transport system substrate-binding protein
MPTVSAASSKLLLASLFVLSVGAIAVVPSISHAQAAAPATTAEEAPDALINRFSNEALDIVKADKAIQAGDMAKVIALVDSKVMPHVNFQRMTAGAVGRGWRDATPAQRQRLQDEFKVLLVRTYSSALAQVKDQTVVVRPLRGKIEDEVLVRTEVRGRGEPLQLDYRMEKTDKGWKIYDFNVLGIWIVQTYQTQFAAEVNKGGIDGLINSLSERNKANAAKKS